jgi:hypothetical protein
MQVHVAEAPTSRIEEGRVMTNKTASLSFFLCNASTPLTCSLSERTANPPLSQAAAPGPERRDASEPVPTPANVIEIQTGSPSGNTSAILRREVLEATRGYSNAQGQGGNLVPTEANGGMALGPTDDQAPVPPGAELAVHLFTIDIDVSLIGSNVSLVPVEKEGHSTFRLSADLRVEEDSFQHHVVVAPVGGPFDEASLRPLLMRLVEALVDHEANDSILAKLVLPDLSHIKLVDPEIKLHTGFATVAADLDFLI